MFKFLRKTALYILALPVLCFCLGAASNQLVLNFNNDKFPVRLSDYKIAQYEVKLEAAAQSDDEDVARQAQFDLTALESEGFLDETHCIMSSKTHLNLLADIFDFRGQGIESVGDMMLDLGMYTWSYAPLVWGLVVVGKLKDQKE